jgi:6-phosphogluconolactonase
LNLQQFANAETLAVAAAERLASAFSSAGGVMVAGGTTPLAAYERVVGCGVRAHRDTTILLSDERYVPREHPASNVRALSRMITSLGIAPERQLLPDTRISPVRRVAEDYAARIATYLDRGGRLGLGVLGMGADGHTASLFDTDDLMRAKNRFAIDVRRPDGLEGVSLTPAVFQHFRELIVLVTGASKRNALGAFQRGDSASVIGRALAGCASVVVWCDADAAPS